MSDKALLITSNSIVRSTVVDVNDKENIQTQHCSTDVDANDEENIQAPHYCPLVKGW